MGVTGNSQNPSQASKRSKEQSLPNLLKQSDRSLERKMVESGVKGELGDKSI